MINKITGMLIEALEKETLTREEGQLAATFILGQKEKINNEISLNSFLEELVKQWPMYKDFTETQKKAQQFDIQDQQKLDQIKNQLSELAQISKQS